jgi:hypothetical protein
MSLSLRNSLFDFIRRLFPFQLIGVPVATPMPLNPSQLVSLDAAPDGLRLLHCAGSVPEAEMLTQILIDEGLHIEFVPSWTTGTFGTTGNSNIYVQQADYDRAAQLLRDYLDGDAVDPTDPNMQGNDADPTHR